MKRILIITILILSILGLSACARKEESVAEETAPASTQEELTEAEPVTEPEPVAVEKSQPESETNVSHDESNDEPSLLHLMCTMVCVGKVVGTNNDGNIDIFYPTFMLFEDDAIQYPKLREALSELNKNYETEYTENLSYSYELGKSALADDTDMQIRFYYSLTPEIRRADSHILSILENSDSYSGGVHGYNAFYGDNFDPKTGKELLLSDVITDQDTFRETVKEKLYAKYPAEQFDDLDTALADMFTTENGAMPWTMDYSGITLYFNPYHIAAYASGMQVITVPFNENPGIFAEDYLDVPNAYVQELNERIPAIVDVNDDGINEVIMITAEGTEGDTDTDDYTSGYQTWTISCGDRELSISDSCYYGFHHLVRANGQYYIYIFEVSDNDYAICSVVDLNTMKNNPSRNFNAFLTGVGSNFRFTDDGYVSVDPEYMFTDPYNVQLSSRMDILGTVNGSKTYKADNEGWPVSDDPYYNVASAMAYIAKQDAACMEVDEIGSEKADSCLQTGKYYVLVRTDNKTWADVQELHEGEYIPEYEDFYPYPFVKDVRELRTDRAIYRLQYKPGEWPHTINGINEDEVFDGIMYAG